MSTFKVLSKTLLLSFFLSVPLWINAQSDSLLSFLTPFVGDWYAAPDSETLKEAPELANMIGFKFSWAHDNQKILRFYEGVPRGDMKERVLECLVAANPRTGVVEFLGFQMRNDFLFKGRFEPLEGEAGFIRLYDVYYPPGTQFRNKTDERKGMKSYRDICRLKGSDTLECTTEQLDYGQYKPWGKGRPYRMARKNKPPMASEKNE